MAQAVTSPDANKQNDSHKSKETIKIIAKVTGADGTVVKTVAEIPGGYMPTVLSAIEIVSRALNGDYKSGFNPRISLWRRIARRVDQYKGCCFIACCD